MSATRNPPRTRIRSMSASARLVLTRRGGHTHRYRRARPAHGFFRPAFDGFGQLLHRAMRFPGFPSDTPRLSTVRSLATVMAENPCGSAMRGADDADVSAGHDANAVECADPGEHGRPVPAVPSLDQRATRAANPERGCFQIRATERPHIPLPSG
jgi:hypothetical protein